MKCYRKFTLPSIVGVVAVGLVLSTTSAMAQSSENPNGTADADPELEARVQEALQIVDPEGFITAATSIHNEKSRFSSDTWISLIRPMRDRAKQLLLETDAIRSLSSQSLKSMVGTARWSMTKAEKTSILEKIATQRDPLGQLDFEQMRVRRQTTEQLVDASSYRGQVILRQLTADWLRSQDLSSLSDKQLSNSLGLVYPWMGSSVLGEASTVLTAEWTGQLTPSSSGKTVFSVSPINVNTEDPGSFSRKQVMQVWVDGRLAIDAKPEYWESESEPIELKKGEPIAVRMKLDYACIGPRWAAIPIGVSLYWEGPNGPRSIVPKIAFATASKEASAGNETGGLLAQFRWKYQGEEEEESATVPNLDAVIWRSTVCSYHDILSELVTELLDRFLASDSLLTLSHKYELAKPSHSPLGAFHLKQCLTICSLDQRAACLDRMMAQEEVMRSSRVRSSNMMRHFYSFARLGNPEQALDLVGTAMQLSSEVGQYEHMSELVGTSRKFWKWNRDQYQALADDLLWEHPPSCQQLEDNYLEMPDGSCCLPAAYTLSYAYLMQGQIKDWIELLDAKLGDTSLAGDRRVNWLLARAQAEEIRNGPPGRYARGRERLLRGRGWLVEAQLVAQDVRLQKWAIRELLARMTATGQWEAAKQLLDQTSLADSQEAFTRWRAKIDALEVAAVELQKQHEIDARQAYLAELKRRRQRGVDAGADVSRYDTLIEAVTAAADKK